MKTKYTEQVNCRVPKDIKWEVDEIAKANDMSVTQWLLKAIQLQLDVDRGLTTVNQDVSSEKLPDEPHRAFSNVSFNQLSMRLDIVTAMLEDAIRNWQGDLTKHSERLDELEFQKSELNNLFAEVYLRLIRLEETPPPPKRGRPRKNPEPN